jgi:Fur family transcriptional regulator, ferric uptake regulator
VYAGGVVKNSKHKRIQDECIAFLGLNGISISRQLQVLVSFFFSTDHHLSFDDIKVFAREQHLELTEKMIRDILSLLVEYGFAISKEFGDSIIRYEHLHYGEHHDHFFCHKCGKIVEFYSAAIEELQLKEATMVGFHTFSHKMQISGLCEKCFGKSSQTLFPLTEIENGGKFSIVEISENKAVFESGHKKKLMGMGVAPGMNGEVLTNTGGRIVVIVNDTRMALGRAMSQCILVHLIN